MATDVAQLEQRVATLEVALAQVQRKLAMSPSATSWVEQVSGSLADIPEEDYQHFLESCRAIRQADHPSEGMEQSGP